MRNDLPMVLFHLESDTNIVIQVVEWEEVKNDGETAVTQWWAEESRAGPGGDAESDPAAETEIHTQPSPEWVIMSFCQPAACLAMLHMKNPDCGHQPS